AAEQRDELAPFHCPMPPVLPTGRIAHLGYCRRLLYCGISIRPMSGWHRATRASCWVGRTRDCICCAPRCSATICCRSACGACWGELAGQGPADPMAIAGRRCYTATYEHRGIREKLAAGGPYQPKWPHICCYSRSQTRMLITLLPNAFG